MMKQKNTFIRPKILQEVTFLCDSPVLQASIVEQTTVTTTGQETQAIDWSDSMFNHEWGN